MLNDKLMKQVDEIKYLASENTWRYRPIIRIFFKNYEKMKYELYKEDIYDELKKYDEFKDYTIDNLKYDLDTLVDNKNLTAEQDTASVKTIEEFKNKQFRYQLSQNTVEIERMVIHLEKLSTESKASLESSLIEKFKENLQNISNIKFKEPKEIYSWWNSLIGEFKNLNENYQDYIRGFYSPKADELMQTTEFLVFKEKLIKYLRSFIKSLQENSFKIEKILKTVDSSDIKEIILKVLEYKKTIPSLDYNTIDDDEFIENNMGTWQSINEWFVASGYKRSDSERLLDITNQIIMKVTRYAAQISERRNSSANRKMEYRKLIKLFYECSNMDDANKLSAVTFGIFNMKHIRGNTIRDTESINSSIYDEKPYEIIIKPKTRTYREKVVKSAIVDKTEKKIQIQKQLIEKRKREKEVIETLIVNKKIDFETLPALTSFQRHTLLRWVSKASSRKSRKGRTEYGRDYTLIFDEGKTITIKSEDGDFTMPKCILEFI